SPGINVLLGTNGTGKSHAMKALYALLKAMEQEVAEQSGMKPLFPQAADERPRYAMKLVNVFKPDGGDLRRLIHRRTQGKPAEHEILADQTELSVRVDPSYVVKTSAAPLPGKVLFLPPRELLSMYEGFLAAYQGRELSFDETYYDACFAL